MTTIMSPLNLAFHTSVAVSNNGDSRHLLTRKVTCYGLIKLDILCGRKFTLVYMTAPCELGSVGSL